MGKQKKSYTVSKQELKIISWNGCNKDSRHIYNSVYQYTNTRSLSLEKKQHYFTDIYHYKIVTLEKDTHPLWGYGTHGQKHDFYTLRLLQFRDNNITDSNNCFNGTDRFICYKPETDTSTRTITYPGYQKNPKTDWTPIRNSIILRYTYGQFYKKNKP